MTGGLMVSGGPLAVDTDVLREVAASLADRADGITLQTDRNLRALALIRGSAGVDVSAAVDATLRATHTGQVAADRMRTMSRQLREAVRRYEETESGLVRELPVSQRLLWVLGQVPTVLDDYLTGLGGALSIIDRLQPIVAKAPWLGSFWPLVTTAPVLAVAAAAAAESLRLGQGGYPTRDGTAWLVRQLAIAAFPFADDPWHEMTQYVAQQARAATDQDVLIRQVGQGGAPAGAGAPVAPASTFAGLVRGIDTLTPDTGTPKGTVRIDAVVAPDGTRSWQVYFPGTQGGYGQEHPTDWAENPGLMVGEASAMTAAAAEALEGLGFQPGEKIMVAGHSQGGMAAMVLANDPRFREDVAGVVTVGSPVGLLEPPPHGTVISIEHLEDPTPGVDGGNNNEGIMSVTASLQESPDPLDRAVHDPAGSHGLPAYQRTAARLDASDDPRITLAFDEMRRQVAPEGAVATSTYWEARQPAFYEGDGARGELLPPAAGWE